MAVENIATDPVDRRGVLAVAQRNSGDPAIAARLHRLALADGFDVALGFGAVDEVVERLVRGFLAGEDEIIAGVRQHGDDGLAGGELVPDIDAAPRAQAS